jgi:Ca2+-binding RTX toxin-like protein
MAIDDTNTLNDKVPRTPGGGERGTAASISTDEALQLAQAAGTPGPAPAAVTITTPSADGRVEVNVEPGARLVFQDVDLAAAQIQQFEGGLLITLANGGVIFLAGYAAAAESADPPVVEVAGIGTIDPGQLLTATSGANLDIAPAAGPDTGVAHGGGASFATFSPGAIGDGLAQGALQPNEDFLRSPPEPEGGFLLSDNESAGLGDHIVSSVPVANPDLASTPESGTVAANFQLMFIIDVSQSVSDENLATGIDAITQLLDTYAAVAKDGADGVEVTLVSFGGSAVTNLSLGSIDQANAVLTSIQNDRPGQGGGTNYDAAVLLGAADIALWDGASPELVNTVYFVSDGAPTVGVGDSGSGLTGGAGLGPNDEAAWNDALSSVGADAYAIGVGDALNGDPVAEDALAAVASPDGNVVLIDAFDDLLAALEDAFESSLLETVVTGNVLMGVSNDGIAGNDSAADSPGTDGYRAPNPVVAFVHDGVTYTPGSPVGGTVLSNSGVVLTVVTALGGEFEFNFNTGAYTYTAPEVDSDQSETFTYTIEDGNGDQASATLTVNVTDVPVVPPDIVANDDTILTAINNDATFTVPHWALLANDTGDGPLSVDGIVTFDIFNFDNVAVAGSDIVVNTEFRFDPGDLATFTYTAGNDDESDDAVVSVEAVASGTIDGGDGAEIIVDNNGGHSLNGGGGDDIIFGNGGNDMLVGGAGNDILTGGDGDDVFHWNSTAEFGDTVTDYDPFGSGGGGHDLFAFDVSTIGVGDNDTTVNYAEGASSAGAGMNVAGNEVIVQFDEILEADVQSTIDGYANITSATLFVFDVGDTAQVWHDPNPSAAGGATLVAGIVNIGAVTDTTFAPNDFQFV